MPHRQKLIHIQLDEKTMVRRAAEVEHERAVAIYDLLEKEVVPHFYDRSGDNVPRAWVATMKASMQSLCPVFCISAAVVFAYMALLPLYFDGN